MLDASPNLDPAQPPALREPAAAGEAAQTAAAARTDGLNTSAASAGPDADQRDVAAFRSGDRDALERIYHRHGDRIWRYARYYSGRDEIAAEIVQETFLRLIRHLAEFEGRARLTTWLFTLARSAALERV
ncbi:MAG: RNA polymerase sigma factor, partial [Planctomycetota bacterium]